MPRFQFVTYPDEGSGAELPALLAGELLRRTGVQWGRAPAPANCAATEPRLRHARALLHLQQRFGPMDHVWRRRATSASPASWPAQPAQADVEEWHLVVEGRLGGQWPVPGGWLRGSWEALEWFTRPAGLRALPAAESAAGKAQAAEWLVLSRARRRDVNGAPGLVNGSGANGVHQAAPPAFVRPAQKALVGAVA